MQAYDAVNSTPQTEQSRTNVSGDIQSKTSSQGSANLPDLRAPGITDTAIGNTIPGALLNSSSGMQL